VARREGPQARHDYRAGCRPALVAVETKSHRTCSRTAAPTSTRPRRVSRSGRKPSWRSSRPPAWSRASCAGTGSGIEEAPCSPPSHTPITPRPTTPAARLRVLNTTRALPRVRWPRSRRMVDQGAMPGMTPGMSGMMDGMAGHTRPGPLERPSSFYQGATSRLKLGGLDRPLAVTLDDCGVPAECAALDWSKLTPAFLEPAPSLPRSWWGISPTHARTCPSPLAVRR